MYDLIKHEYKNRYNEDCTLRDELIGKIISSECFEEPITRLWLHQHKQLRLRKDDGEIVDPESGIGDITTIREVEDHRGNIFRARKIALDNEYRLKIESSSDDYAAVVIYNMKLLTPFRHGGILLLERFET